MSKRMQKAFLFITISGLLLGLVALAGARASLAQQTEDGSALSNETQDSISRTDDIQGPIIGERVVPGLSPAVRDLPAALDEPTLDTEINPRHNPLLFEKDQGKRGTWDRVNVPLDPLIQPGDEDMGRTPGLKFSFEGTGNPTACGGCSPPDTNGDVGPNHYIQMVNATKVAIYDKSGTLVSGPFNLGTLWTSGVCTGNAGDPIVLYDPLADRWLLSQFASPSHMCVAISQTADPTGSYHTYTFDVGSFPDYFKFGVWPDAYYMSANETSYTAYAFDRTNMLAGAAATFQKFTGGTNLYLPSDLDGSTPPPAGAPNYFYTFKDATFHSLPTDRIEIREFHVDWVTPANSTFTLISSLDVAPFTYTVCGFFNFNCVQQLGTAQRVDTVSEWPMFRFPYRNFGTHQSLVGTFTVGGGTGEMGAAIRWFELRNTGGGWTLFQEGTFDPGDGHDRFMASLAMDGSGNIALGYSVSSSTMNPAIRYATRLASDPLGTMQAEAVLINGSGSQTGSNRWGDYTGMAVDPSNDCSFWHTNEYYPVSSSSTWKTRVGVFQIPECGQPQSPVGMDDSFATTEEISLSVPVATGVISTTFASNNGQAGNMFDVTAIHDIHITGFDVHIDNTGNQTVEVYYKAGTYVGFENNPGAWTFLGSREVNSLGSGNPTFVDIGGLAIPAGQVYGLYLQTTTAGFDYTDGSNTYSNADLQLDLGVGVALNFGTVFSPRTWNGQIYYFTGGVLVNDSDPNGDGISAALDTPPLFGGVTVNADGSFDYTPAADFFGTDRFNYIVTDGVLTDTATVSVDVAPVADAPVGVDDSYSVLEDDVLSVGGREAITTTFSDNNEQNGNMFDVTALTDITITGLDLHIASTEVETVLVHFKVGTYVGSETNPADWTLLGTTQVAGMGIGTPVYVDISELSIPAGQTYGLYLHLLEPFHYLRYTNGANTYNNGDLELNLGIGLSANFGSGGIFSPRTWNGRIYYEKGALASILHNDFDVDSDFITVTLDSGPNNGALVFNLDGSFVYTPTTNFSGSDSFTYIASDGVLTDTATVSLNVTPDSPVVVAGPDQNADEGSPVSFAGSFSDPTLVERLNAVSYDWDFGDGNMGSGQTTNHTYLDNGVYTVTLTVTDDQGGVGSDSLLVTVSNVAPSLVALPNQSSGVGQSVDLAGSFTDPGILDTFDVEIEWEPGVFQNLSLPAGASTFNASHIYTSAGTYTVNVTMTDDDGGNSMQSFTVEVNYLLYLPNIVK